MERLSLIFAPHVTLLLYSNRNFRLVIIIHKQEQIVSFIVNMHVMAVKAFSIKKSFIA